MQGEEVQEHEAGKERLKAERAREKLVRMGLIGSCLQPPDTSDHSVYWCRACSG